MKPQHFIRTDLAVPGVGSVIHVAELEEIDSTQCTMLRLIELTPDESIAGARTPQSTVGAVTTPADRVPHPDTYEDFPDIQVTRLSHDEFDALWSEAQAKFPQLGD